MQFNTHRAVPAEVSPRPRLRNCAQNKKSKVHTLWGVSRASWAQETSARFQVQVHLTAQYLEWGSRLTRGPHQLWRPRDTCPCQFRLLSLPDTPSLRFPCLHLGSLLRQQADSWGITWGGNGLPEGPWAGLALALSLCHLFSHKLLRNSTST